MKVQGQDVRSMDKVSLVELNYLSHWVQQDALWGLIRYDMRGDVWYSPSFYRFLPQGDAMEDV